MTINQSTNQWGNSICWAPTKARFILVWIGLTNSIVLELWEEKKTFLLIKSKRDRRLFSNYSGIKTVWEKIGFFKFIWKIGVSKITWKSKFWKLNLRIGILDIKFKRNWNFEN